ncbi:unnamed protein product [Agarophyton chilense]
METVGDERIRATKSLKQIEEAALMLENLSKSGEKKSLSSGLPNRLSSILNSINSISSRDDAERLLAAGVSIWNSIISVEAQSIEKETKVVLVRVRHIAVDCMYMSTTALDGISARYNIDSLSLLKFYTACGQKYVAEINDTDSAVVCYSKANEFASVVLKEPVTTIADQTVLSRVMFDLLIGRAECSWEREEFRKAEDYVQQARKYLKDLPGEFEFLATVEYNFGLFTYQEKDTIGALRWLQRSIQTRGDPANKSMNEQKQAKTFRLAGVCLLALQRYDGSWDMMKKAEETSHDPIGSYLLLKLSVITRKDDAADQMMRVIEDPNSNIDVCIAAVSLFGDAQRVSEAVLGYEELFKRFEGDPGTQACTIGPRYFEALCAIGHTQKALVILKRCSGFMARLSDFTMTDQDGNQIAEDIDKDSGGGKMSQFLRWSALLLSIGSSQADRRDFKSSVLLLTRALDLARAAKDISARQASSSTEPHKVLKNIVLDNEARVCRLASSCALCSITDVKQKIDMSVNDGCLNQSAEEAINEERNLMLNLSLQHANRAKEIEPDDYSPRLLLFRTHLMSGNHLKAASELESSCTEIRSFDPGALAEAACAARDVGSTASVVAVLRCILALDSDVLMKWHDSTAASPPNGFYGTVLLACIKLQQRNTGVSGPEGSEKPSSETSEGRINAPEELLNTLTLGLNGVMKLGLDVAFEKSEDFEDKISYLVNICWNAGIEAGTNMQYDLWESFFSICYEFYAVWDIQSDTNRTEDIAKCRMHPSVLFVTPLIALPLLAATIWRRRAVIRRLSAVIIALDDGGLLERPEEGLTRLAALENDSAPASLPQLSDRLKSLSDSVATPPSAVTPLLSVVRAPLQAAFSSLANHPVVQLHGLLSRLFQTLGIISVLHPLLTTVMGGVAWLLSKPKESVAINVLGAVSGAGSQIGTWAVRKRVLRLVSDAVEQLVDEEVERLVGEGVGDGLMDGISKIGGDSVDMAQFNLLPRP